MTEMENKRILPTVFWWISLVASGFPVVVRAWSLIGNRQQCFGLIVPVALLLTAGIAALRWDGVFRLPVRRWPLYFYGLGSVCLVCSGVFAWNWLGVLAFAWIALSFLAVHNDAKTDGSLTSVWPLLLVVVGVPGDWEWNVYQVYVSFLRSMTESTLSFFSIPIAVYPSAIVFSDQPVFLYQFVSSIISWPLLLLCAAAVSVWRRRSVAESLMNVVLLFVCLPVFHVLTITSLAWWSSSTWAESNIGLQWTLAQLGCLGGTVLIFASLDRLGRVMLSPISAAYFSAKANPLFLLWNRVVLGDRQSTESISEPPTGLTAKLALSTSWVVLATGGVLPLFLRSAEFGFARAARMEVILEDQPDVSVLDLPEARRAQVQLNRLPATQVAIWTGLRPLLSIEISVFDRPIDPRTVERFATSRGWEHADEPGIKANVTGEFGVTTKGNVTSQLAYLTLDGKVRFDCTAAGPPCITVHMLSEHPKKPTTEQLEADCARFQAALTQIANALGLIVAS